MEAGSLIGRYKLVRRIGEGGMGEVWEATHEVTRKSVAIKVLNATYSKQPPVRARFLQEARAACRVRHPNVVQVHDVIDLEDGAPAMVMDLLHGESLAAKLERERAIALTPLAIILAPVVEAMGVAHKLGIVHRDLKPDNLFLESLDGGAVVVKVLDFGIAKVTRTGEELALTGTGAVLGTPYYMSPEQAFGEKDLDYRSDVWSLGIILYECLTGRRPTEADNFGQILKTITTGSIPPLSEIAPSLPREVADLVWRMLRADRTARPELAEVLEVLQRYGRDTASGRSVVIVSHPPAAGAPSADVATQAALVDTAESFELSQAAGVPRKPFRPLPWAAAGLIAAALAGGVFLQMRSDRRPADRATPSSEAPREVSSIPPIAPSASAVTPTIVADPTPPVPAASAPSVPRHDRPAAARSAAAAVSAPAAAPVAPPAAPASAKADKPVGKLHEETPF